MRIPPESVDPRIKSFHWGDMTRGLFESFEAGCDDFEQGGSVGIGYLLLEAGELQTVPSPDAAAVQRLCAGQHVQQRRFAGAVAAHQTDPFAQLDAEPDFFE